MGEALEWERELDGDEGAERLRVVLMWEVVDGVRLQRKRGSVRGKQWV